MKPAFEKFREIIEYERNNIAEFRSFGKVTKFFRDQALLIIKDQEFEKTSEKEYSYKHFNKTTGIINVENISCSCPKYLDKAICKHLIAVCLKEKIHLPG